MAASKGKAGGETDGALHGDTSIFEGGDQNGGNAFAEIRIKARGVKSKVQEGGKKVVGSEGMARVNSKGNVGLRNRVGTEGEKGVGLKGVQWGGK